MRYGLKRTIFADKHVPSVGRRSPRHKNVRFKITFLAFNGFPSPVSSYSTDSPERSVSPNSPKTNDYNVLHKKNHVADTYIHL